MQFPLYNSLGKSIKDTAAYNFTGVEVVDISGVGIGVEVTTFDFTFTYKGGTGASNNYILNFNSTDNSSLIRILAQTTGTRINLAVKRDVSSSVYQFTQLGVSASAINTIRFQGDKSRGTAIGYLNGSQICEITFEGILSASQSLTFKVGAFSASNQPLVGVIYNYILKLNGKKYIYRCNETSGVISFDSSYNDNDGVITLGTSSEASFHLIL